MNKKWATFLVIAIILVFIGYIISDLSLKKEKVAGITTIADSSEFTDAWMVSKVFEPRLGKLTSVATSDNGNIILGGESFVSDNTPDLGVNWILKTDKPVTAVSASGDTVFASTLQTVLVINGKGELISEWGPFEDSAIITSIASNKPLLAFADAQNKIIFVLDKKGNVRKIIGLAGEPFSVPSNFFDVAFAGNNNLYDANPGNRRIETRTTEGTIIRFFGEPGMAPGAFCGCCNPAHFAVLPGGFVTAEKGINRIKILNEKGDFVEFVSSRNSFAPSTPLDVASYNGKVIYAANPADSKLYVFKRKS
jgi:hypothetical protein